MDSNKWLTPEQRAALEKKGEELHAGRHQSRLNRRVNLDFAGRRVVEAADEISYDMNQVKIIGFLFLLRSNSVPDYNFSSAELDPVIRHPKF